MIIKKIVKKILIFFNLYLTIKVDKDKIISFIKILKPWDVKKKFIRIGGNNDGGYIIPDDLKNIDYCFSPGVGNSTLFETELLKYKIKSFLTDHTIKYNNNFKKFSFLQKELSCLNGKKKITLEKWIDDKLPKYKQNNLLLQMDIDGSEYEVLLSTTDKILKKFRILIIEFHNLDYIAHRGIYPMYLNLFKKITKNFTICHLHQNNSGSYVKYDGILIPKILEISFIRNDLVKSKTKIKNLPHPLDAKNVLHKSDFNMPDYYYK
jgi:hypothetical protein